MSFVYFHFIFLELFLFLGLVFFISKLTIIQFRDGINKFLLGSIVVQ